jgi:hypothetical protein
VASLGFVVYKLYQKAGPMAAEFFDDRAKGVLDNMMVGKNAQVADLQAQLAEAKAVPGQLEGIKDVFAISRELNDMSRELEYRMEVQSTRSAAINELDNMIKVENEVVRACACAERVRVREIECGVVVVRTRACAVRRGCTHQCHVHSEMRKSTYSPPSRISRIYTVQRGKEQAELVAAVKAAVLEGLKGKEKEILAQCVSDLQSLAAAR